MAKRSKKDEVFTARKILLTEKSPFSVQEAYKTLRTNVSFSLPGNKCKCIGICSSSRGEGKSSIAVNLAISFAQINKKVVLVDCDMRLPTVAAKLNINGVPGLSNFLTGDLEALPIQRINSLGIDVITSGNIPPDSTTLIASSLMAETIEVLKERYDYIIFDFPPVTIVSDAVLLSDKMDGYLIVTRHMRSEFQEVSETIRHLRFASAKIIGFVYNGKISDKKYYKKKDKSYYKEYSKKSKDRFIKQ